MVTGNNESRLESWCVTRKHPNSNLSRMANSLCVENAIVRARTHTHTHTHIFVLDVSAIRISLIPRKRIRIFEP